jgi:anti-sigma-K factor RskA
MTIEEERDLLAGEYALGCLEGEDLREAERLAGNDEHFAAAVRAWEQRFLPLVSLAPPTPPDAALWARIEASTGSGRNPSVAEARRHTPIGSRFWKMTTAGALALAASLATLLVVRPAGREAVAILTSVQSSAPVFVALADRTGALKIRALGSIAIEPGKDLELWALPAGATRPTSLGVLTLEERTVPAGIAQGTQLLVSLEPKGGSPTGQPTGPVVYAGRLTALD